MQEVDENTEKINQLNLLDMKLSMSALRRKSRSQT